ncbi:MAG: hypothetical protein COT35_00715 [Nitrospirae bacterium CG08_land_8_20_14_0_20_52_24]|nr:MAG: hypothetical protein COT35_00715 [Nitrospirae bacterium CG08_land_8_20_14_0_20_52_24]
MAAKKIWRGRFTGRYWMPDGRSGDGPEKIVCICLIRQMKRRTVPEGARSRKVHANEKENRPGRCTHLFPCLSLRLHRDGDGIIAGFPAHPSSFVMVRPALGLPGLDRTIQSFCLAPIQSPFPKWAVLPRRGLPPARSFTSIFYWLFASLSGLISVLNPLSFHDPLIKSEGMLDPGIQIIFLDTSPLLM